MTTTRISRFVVTCAAALFAGVATAIWAAPERAAQYLGLDIAQPAGTAAVRADLGGLFAGMAALCAIAAWSRRRSWSLGAAAVLSGIVIGRSINWISQRTVGADVPDLAIELVVIAGLFGLTRNAGATERSNANVTPLGTISSRTWQRAIVVGTLVMVSAVGAAALMSGDLQQRIFDAGAQRMAATINTAPLADDALRVAICGSSAPLPSARRAKACVAVFAGGKFYVVDTGPESVENLVLWGIPLSSIGGVLLTHFHSDHIGDLGELNLQTWAGGRPAPLDVYGGPGIERIVDGFNTAYRLDQGYRTAHHTDRVMPAATWPMVSHVIELDGPATVSKDRSAVVLNEGGLRITAFEVDHTPIAPAYAYRFDYKGRSALITGDLKFHPPLAKAAAGVDVLVSEAIAVSMTRALGKGASAGGRDRAAAIMHDIEDYHITPEQAAQIANDAGARLLVFYHLLPAPDGPLARRVFAQGVDKARRGEWAIADDGSLYTLPLGSQSVHIGSINDQ